MTIKFVTCSIVDVGNQNAWRIFVKTAAFRRLRKDLLAGCMHLASDSVLGIAVNKFKKCSTKLYRASQTISCATTTQKVIMIDFM